ncbi:MAG TPA: ATP synthase F1 subunit delta [Prolixibacteraceae bacterium]|nr:ATP synthase F1 subunit delta [Prolixibacteraceae bacterium]HPR61394.1 ATP synthase F1 subunit delta [Prolixibacteraceae bacterium]
MDTNRVTVRYAKALVELAIDQNIDKQVYADMLLIVKAMTEYPAFAEFINNPAIASIKKSEKVVLAFKTHIQQLTLNFLILVFNKKREFYLNDICRNALDLLRQHNHTIVAHLEMSIEPDIEMVQKIKEKFEHKLKQTVELSTTSNPKLIGGFVFTIDGLQYDASLATRLKKISKELQQNT